MRSVISISAAAARRRKASRVAVIVSGAWSSSRSQTRATSASSVSCDATASKYPIGSKDSAVGISASNNIRFTQLTPSVAQSRRKLAPERQLPKVRAIGNSKPRAGGGETDVAGICDGESGPCGNALNHRDAGYVQALQPVDKAVELRFVGDAIIPVGELTELRDVGARDKSLAAGAAEHSDADATVSVNRGTGGSEPVVHRPGHRVACPWPIKLNMGHCAGNTQCHLSVAR